MIDAVFISDLHLNPEEPFITARFNSFIDWAAKNTSKLFILGDFFHVWSGDDALDEWSEEIVKRLLWLTKQQVTVYFMRGNRDFLIGEEFARKANVILLQEPTVLNLEGERIFLVHGDGYCTLD